MNLSKFFLFLLLITPKILFCQIDSIHNWEKIVYEVISTKYDSLNNHSYISIKEPFFIAYFDYFSEQDLDSIMNKYQILGNNPNMDSINDPQYIAKVKFCWVMMEMRMRIGIKQSLKKLNEYYDSFGDTIQLEFIKNGKEIILDNNFKIYYVLNVDGRKRIVETEVLYNAFLAPDIGKDSVGKIILEYGNQFYDITLCENNLNVLKREVKLTLFFETKPYPKATERHDLKNIRDELDKRKDMRGIFYVSTERLRICKYDYFKHESEFFQQGKKIMNR